MPQDHREHGYRLGTWASTQRENIEIMSSERRQQLEALGFMWDALTNKWEEGFRHLTVYCQREGHCLVPALHREHGYPLGTWVSQQRYHKDTMSPERRQRLEALGFTWDALTNKWENGFHYLTVYCQREGHCRVPGTIASKGIA